MIYPVPMSELPDNPTATHWAWQTGNRWMAVLEGERETWWDGADPADEAARPDNWFRAIDDLPDSGTILLLNEFGVECTFDMAHDQFAGPYGYRLLVEVVKRTGVIYDDDGANGTQRYLLVEASRYDATLYLTTHDSPEDAADYHDNQECPEDWNVKTLVDLSTGDELDPTTTTTFDETPVRPLIVVIETPDADPTTYTLGDIDVEDVSAYPTSRYCPDNEIEGYGDDYLANVERVRDRFPDDHPAREALNGIADAFKARLQKVRTR